MRKITAALAIATTIVAGTGTAVAGGYASATVTPIWDHSVDPSYHVGDRVDVHIAPDPSDAGKPGAYFIGADVDGESYAIYTATGWKVFDGGLYEAVAITDSMPGGTQSFNVLDGSQTICQVASQLGVTSNVTIWGGYGVLQPDKEAMVQNFHAHKNPRIPPDHIRSVYTINDMSLGKKYTSVHTESCYTGGN